jgi:outer membrane protein assembly factor BamB
MRLTIRTAIILTVVCGASLQAQSGSTDWPQWRGVNRDGGAAGFRAPARWPDALTLKWKRDIGAGYSTPIVIGDVVYTFSRAEKGEEEAVMAFEAGTGKPLWQATYPAPYVVVKAAAGHGLGPKSTPVYADGRLFTFGISGILTALDAKTGKILWQKPAPDVGPMFTTSQSPLIDRGRLIVHLGGNAGGALSALDPATGDVKWEWKGDGPGYGSPIVADLGGTRQVITFTLDNLVGVSADTGELLWQRPFKAPSQVNASTPIVYGDTVIVAGNQSGIAALRVSRRDGKWVAEEAWRNDDVYYHLSNAVIVGDALFGLSPQQSGSLFYVNAKSGATLWRGGPRTAANAAIARAGTILFILKADGELVVADGAQTGALTPIKTYKVAETPTWGQPAIAGQRIFVKDQNSVALWTIE